MNDSEDDEVDEVMYGIDESQTSSDGDDQDFFGERRFIKLKVDWQVL